MMPASRRNVFWAGLEAAASGLLSFGGAFVIARLTGPSEFGVGAAVTSVHVLLWVGVNALFSDALVQRSDLDEATAASAFWASTIAGACCALMQAGAGWVLAAALSDSRLIAMACLLALPLPAVGQFGAHRRGPRP